MMTKFLKVFFVASGMFGAASLLAPTDAFA